MQDPPTGIQQYKSFVQNDYYITSQLGNTNNHYFFVNYFKEKYLKCRIVFQTEQISGFGGSDTLWKRLLVIIHFSWHYLLDKTQRVGK